MEPEEEAGSAGQNQNLHDLQNYLVTFKNEIEEGSDDVLPGIDVDGGDVNDLYSGSGNHLQDPGDGEVSGQFSSGFYSEQGMLGTTLTDDSPQQQMQNLVSSTEAEADSEISSAKDGVSGIDLERVQAQIAGYGASQLSQAIPGMQGGSAHQGIIMTSLGDGLDPNTGKMIQIVSLGGEEGQYLSLADGQQMQILNSEDLGLTSESLEQIDNSVDLNSVSSAVTALNNSNPQMALVSLPGSVTEMPSSSISIMAPDNKDISTGQIAAAVGDGASLFNSGLASLVALPSSMEGAQHQLFALHRPGIGPEPLQMTSLLGGEGIASQDLGCQTITIVPSDMSQNGEMNYVLILTQPDGTKDGVASMAQICDFKQETTEITDTIVDHNGETKNVLRLVPKKLVGEMSNQQLVCDYCNYTSPKRYLLTRHMKSHSEERPFKCEACSRGFKTAASLLNHVNTHTGTRPHKCKTCAAAFTTSGELVRHIRYRHTFEKPHRCPECDYASVELSKLKRHMRSHTGERPYKCPSCPYASPDTYKLKRHMRIHTGEKPYECDICHARFTQSNSLKAHKLIHTGNKPIYQCSLCPTTCGRKTDLKIHFNKLHAIGSPLDCKKCGKAFSDRYSYKQHVRSHDMDKCFKCDHCDFMAATEKNLELHMSVHGRKYECDECHLSFILKHLLDKHKAMFHGNAMAKDVNAADAGKSKDESDSGFVTVLGRYDLSDLQSESEESAHIMLSTPSASDTLHKNLMQDIKEGKLGDVPQVVIVHPDGSQEEISSKLTGDKWSIEELFSTATNNGQTGRYDDPDREMEENKDKEPDLSLPASDDASAASHLADSLLQTTVDEGQGSMMIVPEEEGQDSCFTHTEVSQLCEASTQAEIESDTDSSGETPDQEVLNASHTMQHSTGKLSKEVEGSLQQSLKIGTCTGKTPSSSSSSSCTAFNQTNPLEMSSEPTVSSFPTSYLKSLIQKPLVIKSPSSSSSSSSSSPSSLLSSLSSTKKLTSVLQLPKKLLSTSNTSVKTNSSGQQYSLLKNLNLSSGSLMAASDSGQIAKTGKDSVVKLFVNFGSSGSDNSSSNMKDNLSDPSSNLSGVLDPHPSSPSPLPTNGNPTSVSTLSAVTGANENESQEQSNELGSNLYFDISKETSPPAMSEASSSATQASHEIDISNHNADAVSTNVSSQVTASLRLCDNELSPPSTWSSLTPAATTNTITAQVSSMIESHCDEKLNPEFTIFEPVSQNDNLAPILNLNSCDSDDKRSLSISTSESGILSVAMDQPSTTERFPEQNLNNDVIPVNVSDPISVVGCPKSSSNGKGNAVLRRGKVDSVTKGVDVVTPAAKKSKPVKRHSDMDQSLVMHGKRVRKALVKVSL